MHTLEIWWAPGLDGEVEILRSPSHSCNLEEWVGDDDVGDVNARRHDAWRQMAGWKMVSAPLLEGARCGILADLFFYSGGDWSR